MQSRIVSKDVFDFDRLTARPLLSMLDYSDLDKLYNIASSIRYSGDIQKKLNAIRDVMHAKGFRKLSQGTNRITYSYYEDPSIVVKIATDRVGMKDNPREFINQEKLKPFVTKIFEVTPDGVVGEAERVQPITSREEFLSCADEIYGLLNLLTTKYVLADVGSKYFMNYGIRSNNFGPVLLDFPYLYDVDGNKLVCKAPNLNEPSGICGGWIDYDPGFNDLVCLKCGVKYKAIEIAKGIEENKIIRKGRQTRMKVAVNWKGKNQTKEVSLDGQLVSDAFKTPTPIVRPAVNKETVGKLKVATPVVKKEVKEVAVTAEEVKVVERPVEKEQVVETPVVEEKVEVPAVEKVEEVKPEVPQKKVEDKKAGLKVKMTTQDGKTVESTVDHSSEDEDVKKSNLKVNNNPVSNRHYNANHDSNMPRKSQIQLTAITFEQLKELDFKYRSTDLEFHKMFFEAKHEKSNPSISVDFDSIPKEKLVLIAGNEAPETEEEVAALKEELEKAKFDLNETEEALANLRKVTNGNNEVVVKLQENNVILENANKELTELLAARDAEIAELKRQLEEAQTTTTVEEDVEVETPVQETVEEPTEEYEDEFDCEDFSFIYGTWQYIEDVCEAHGFKKPENLPFDSILTFSANGDPDDEIIKDQNGKVICMAWINGHAIDQLEIKPKDQVIIGQVEAQPTEE